ncbi:MAG: hypothetical protein GWO02_08565, partial [Gammaproteobacteria bacterium]|nr:hypothetical protein [Gammaproteobacteria bacterium]
MALVSEKEQADYIVEIRSGALSINRRSDYIGLGGFSVPTPSTVPVQLPQANLYADNDRTGLAKFSASVYRAEDGLLASVVGPVYGVAWIDQDAILGVGWRNTNTL